MGNNKAVFSQELINERQALVLKGEENGFVFYNGNLYKKINSDKNLVSVKDRYISFELDEFYGDNILLYPKFGISTFPAIKGFDFSACFFDTYNTLYAYSSITSVFDSIVNFFRDGMSILERYSFSYRVTQAEIHVIFATKGGEKITFSSSGRYFRGRLISNSEDESNDLYGV